MWKIGALDWLHGKTTDAMGVVLDVNATTRCQTGFLLN
jgi:hypothetical protein